MSEEFEQFLKEQGVQEYFKKLKETVSEARKTKRVFPDSKLIFNALKQAEYPFLKVVIVGVEPYNISGHEMGIAFSSMSQTVPRELVEIQNEIRRSEYSGFPFNGKEVLFRTNNLTQWVQQGVLPINKILTAVEGEPLAHKNIGWEIFTTELIKMLNNHHHRLVFMLWGKDTHELAKYIDDRHLILKAPKPGSGKFYGCDHFKLANDFIMSTYKQTKDPIGWHTLTN